MKPMILIGLLVALAGCGTVATPTRLPSTSQPTQPPIAIPTTVPTALPTVIPVIDGPTQMAVSEVQMVGDPKEGEKLFKTFQPAAGIACSTCHRVDSDERLVGPGLLTVGERAKTRVEGMDEFDYIHTSIVDPKAYVVEGYSDIMPKNWGQVFTEDQLDDLIAYLISLNA